MEKGPYFFGRGRPAALVSGASNVSGPFDVGADLHRT